MDRALATDGYGAKATTTTPKACVIPKRFEHHRFVMRRAALVLLVAAIGYVGLEVVTSSSAKRTTAPPHRANPSLGRATAKTTTPPASGGTPVLHVYEHLNSVRVDVQNDLARVYVPSGRADTVSVIDARTKRVISSFSTGVASTPQHIVPSFDLKTLWVLDNKSDFVVPIDAHTGTVGKPIAVNDPYNLYFTLDGRSAIVVAELHRRLDFRDPHTMMLQQSVAVPGCNGINHADYAPDGRYMLLTCEFSGTIAKLDIASRTITGYLHLRTPNGQAGITATMPDLSRTTSMPQDIRLSPDGTKFYVADMLQGGLHVIDGTHLREIGFISTGIGTHSVTPSRDGTRIYVANRSSTSIRGKAHGPGSVSVIDPHNDRVIATWPVPGGGSPDMGNLNRDGTELWLSGRFDHEVYVFNTATGRLITRIAVPDGPHGLTVWPQPGRYSLGHTGNMR